MRTAVDYFGLMAYMWVMSGGMLDGDLLSPPERKPTVRTTRARRLRVIKGGKPLDQPARRVFVAEEDEAVA